MSISRPGRVWETWLASEMRLSVALPIAETTTTTSLPWRFVICTFSATARMRSGSATDVPPYFWTIRAIGGPSLPAGVDRPRGILMQSRALYVPGWLRIRDQPAVTSALVTCWTTSKARRWAPVDTGLPSADSALAWPCWKAWLLTHAWNDSSLSQRVYTK